MFVYTIVVSSVQVYILKIVLLNCLELDIKVGAGAMKGQGEA